MKRERNSKYYKTNPPKALVVLWPPKALGVLWPPNTLVELWPPKGLAVLWPPNVLAFAEGWPPNIDPDWVWPPNVELLSDIIDPKVGASVEALPKPENWELAPNPPVVPIQVWNDEKISSEVWSILLINYI